MKILKLLLLALLPMLVHAQTNVVYLPGSTPDNTVVARNNLFVNGTAGLGGTIDTTGSVTGLPLGAVRTRPQDSLTYRFNGRITGRKWDLLSLATMGVTSINVNGGGAQSGAISLTIPTNNNQLTNGANYITAAGAPVQTVNGQTGTVVLDGSETKVTGDNTYIQVLGLGTVSSPYQAKWLFHALNADSIGHKFIDMSGLADTYVLAYQLSGNKLVWVAPGTAGTGISSLNTLTASTQSFAIGTSGTDFNISSSVATHTFNIPDASSSARGLLTAANFTAFNAKQNQLNGTGLVRMSGTTVSYDNAAYLTANQTISFTPNAGGDITGAASGSTAINPTLVIGNNKVTYGKIQQASTGSVLLGAQSVGNYQEIQLGSGLSMTGGVLNTTGAGTGITALNGLTSSTQTIVTGTSGTDFNITDVGSVHTLNLPDASASARGLLTAANFTAFNSKQAQLNGTGFVKASGTTISYDNSTYLTANQSITATLTGAVTGTATGTTSLTIATTIPAGSIGLSKFATGPAGYVVGYDPSGNPAALPPDTVFFHQLGPYDSVMFASNGRLVSRTIKDSTGFHHSTNLDSSWTFYVGGLTNSNLSGSAGITNANLNTMAGHTYKGNSTGSAATPTDVTNTQLTADLIPFTTSSQGVVPSPGGTASGRVLQDDGAWHAPASGATLASKAIAFGNSSNQVAGDTSKLKFDSTASGSTYHNVNAAVNTARYVDYFIGNSESVGYGLPNTFDSWVYLTAWRMGDSAVNLAHTGWTLQNTGWAGALGNWITNLNQIPTYGASSKLLFIALGVNDHRYVNASFDTATFRAAYYKFIDTCTINRGWPAQRIILVSPFYIEDLTYYTDSATYAFPSKATQLRNQQFGAVVQSVATVKGTKFVDGYAAIVNNGKQQLIQSDSLHMNQYGQRAAAEAALAIADTIRMGGQRLAVNGPVQINNLVYHAPPVYGSPDGAMPLGLDSLGNTVIPMNINYNKVMIGGAKSTDDPNNGSKLIVKGSSFMTAINLDGTNYQSTPSAGNSFIISRYPAAQNWLIAGRQNWATGTAANLSLWAYGGQVNIGGLSFNSLGTKLTVPSTGLDAAAVCVTGFVQPTTGQMLFLGFNGTNAYIYPRDMAVGTTYPLILLQGNSSTASPLLIGGTASDGVNGFQIYRPKSRFYGNVGIQTDAQDSAQLTLTAGTNVQQVIRFINTASSVLASTPVAGAVETLNDSLYYTLPSTKTRTNWNFPLTRTVKDSSRYPANTLYVDRAVANGLATIVQGVNTVDAFSSSSQTNGATISGTHILFGPADATNSGMVSTGAQTFAGAKTFNATASFNNGINGGSSTTATFPHLSSLASSLANSPGTGAGTGPTITVTGSDNGGIVTVTTGTSPAASADIVGIGYAFNFQNNSYVTITPGNANAAALSGASHVYITSTNSGFTIKGGSSALAASTTYIWNFTVIGN